MPTYFVSSSGNDVNSGLTWALAKGTLAGALSVATSNGDIVVIQRNAVPTGDAESAADTTYTFAADVSLVSATADDANVAYTLSAMNDDYWIGSSTASRAVTFSGAFEVYIYGITLRNAATSGKTFSWNSDGGVRKLEKCTSWVGSTQSSCRISLVASASNNGNGYTEAWDCTFRFASTSQSIFVGGNTKVIVRNCKLHASSSVPSVLFLPGGTSGTLFVDGCDFSNAGATMLGALANNGVVSAYFINSKVPASVSWLATQTPLTLATNEVFVFNCASGDTHFDFMYLNPLGTLTAFSTVHADGGAKFNGTNGVSWKIDTTAYASRRFPFVTPWIDLYHSGTSTITPYLEVIRDNSAAAVYKDTEVWSEWGYQGGTNSPLSLFKSDEETFLGAGTNQATSSCTWTGATGTPGKFKVDSGTSMTPTEIGMLRARVCVAINTSSTPIYVDPYIRTA